MMPRIISLWCLFRPRTDEKVQSVVAGKKQEFSLLLVHIYLYSWKGLNLLYSSLVPSLAYL
jgi:hypothetical protein